MKIFNCIAILFPDLNLLNVFMGLSHIQNLNLWKSTISKIGFEQKCKELHQGLAIENQRKVDLLKVYISTERRKKRI